MYCTCCRTALRSAWCVVEARPIVRSRSTTSEDNRLSAQRMRTQWPTTTRVGSHTPTSPAQQSSRSGLIIVMPFTSPSHPSHHLATSSGRVSFCASLLRFLAAAL
eukprot:CAMPEP_0179842708 /NCGR_PEP_ID=MMETSP0982-20121206/3281_1 /TAXON_ID=483367 /ORGANISM="non described non described, Strain CCMP 2436" /LENGTH=104 /DNA_ID=CAMNT_0021727019 /DNA_START=261 /DNA_END=575 /DNA_ORIENTATION=-